MTRDLPPRVRGGISTAVGAMMQADPASAAVSFDGWRPSGGGGAANIDGRVCRLDGPGGLADATAFAVAQRPTRVLVHHAMLWEFGRAVGQATGAPVDLFVHVVQAALRRMRGLPEPTGSERMQRTALAQADRLLLPGEAARALLAEHHPDAAARALVQPLVIPAPPPSDPAPREPGRVLCVGRFDVLKGTADALAALEPLLALVPDARLVLVGGLPDNPKSQARWLRRWRASVPTHVAERLEATGWLPAADVAAQLARASVVLAPSHAETFGLAVLEAQRAGCAIVATDIPAHRERVTPGPRSRLVPVGDVPAIAGALASLLRAP